MNVTKKLFSPGFTLVELLVTIGIIVILAAGGMAVYTNSQRRARDVRQVNDLKAIQSAFEQYYVANGTYAACNTMAADLQGGLPLTPQGVAYTQVSCDATGYCLCTPSMEVAGKGNSSANNNCNNFTTNGDYFCIKNLQ